MREKLAQTLLGSAKQGREKAPHELYERVLELEPQSRTIVIWPEWEQHLNRLETEENYDTALKLAQALREHSIVQIGRTTLSSRPKSSFIKVRLMPQATGIRKPQSLN